jgi:TPR repeat protein
MERPGDSPVRVGDQLDGYTLLALLGEGGMGHVYRAVDPSTDRHVALKVVRAQGSGPTREKRFVREAQLTAAITDPAIVRVHAAGKARGHRYIAYELIDGAQQLDEAWYSQPLETRVGWVREAARAVGTAHVQGIVHRDLKPANILIGSDGRVRIADFGLASMVGLERLTLTGQMLGTPTHMSPEQVSGRTSTAATDVWALGVLLYQALTGELPFDGDSMIEQLALITSAAPVPPHTLRPETPPALSAVCARAMACAPSDRYPDGAAFAHDLDVALGGGEVCYVGPSWSLARHAIWLVPTIALAMLLGVALFVLGEKPVPPEPLATLGPPAPDVPPPDSAIPAPRPVAARRSVAELLPAAWPGEGPMVQSYRQRAVDGDAHAVGKLGRWHLAGQHGLPRLPDLGLALLERSSELGDASTLLYLARKLLDGIPGILEADPARAISLLEDAATRGNSGAVAQLGVIYASGISVPKQPTRALQYLDRGAADGNALALHYRGILFRDDLDDPQQACLDLQAATLLGKEEALLDLELLLLREQVLKRPLPEAEKWLCQQVRDGLRGADAVLGRLLMGQANLKRMPNGFTALRLESSDDDPRELHDIMNFRVNGRRCVDLPMGTRALRRLTCEGNIAHMWIVWTPWQGRVTSPWDMLTQRADAEVVVNDASPPLSTVTFMTTTDTPKTGVIVFVAEDVDGRLSNLAFARVTDHVPLTPRPRTDPLAEQVRALLPPALEGDTFVLSAPLRREAISGNVAAIAKLGGLLFKGNGAPKWPVYGLEHMTLAAEHGSAHAMNDLAEILASGRPGLVNADPPRALALFRRAAGLGNGPAFDGLAREISQGGLEQEPSETKAWFYERLTNADPDANHAFARLLMGPQRVLGRARAAPTLRWGPHDDSPSRPIRAGLELRLDGGCYVEKTNGQHNAYRFRMRGTMAHLWVIRHPIGPIAEPSDLMTFEAATTTHGRTEGGAKSTTLLFEHETQAQKLGVWIYVAENDSGELSNPVYVRVVP